MTILDDILDDKRREVEAARARRGEDELAREAAACREPVRGFRQALARAEAPAIIAELKRRSPSKGLIRPDFDPVEGARAYQQGGAAAISVLTDAKYFGGELGYLRAVREAVPLPLLRKDFVVDGYQIDEARVAGADAVLLIVAALRPDELADLHKRGRERGLDVLVEVHDEAELEAALTVGADLIGVNNRDLRTFDVDLAVSERLAARLPASGDVLLVAESGIHTPADVERLRRAGARAFLVGESLMRERDLAVALAELRRTK